MAKVLVNWSEFPSMVNGLWVDDGGVERVVRKERMDLNTMLVFTSHGESRRYPVVDPHKVFVSVEIAGD